MKKAILNIIKLLSKLIKKDDNLITIIYRGYSGSNLSPIIERLKDEKYNEYNINIILDGKASSDYETGKLRRVDLYKKRLKKYKSVLKSKLVVTTHGFYRLRSDNFMINLWHGIPIKSMALMNKAKTDEVNLVEDDYFISTSETFNTIMNSCLGITADKYHIAGYPRNDYLFVENGVENLNELLDSRIGNKVILFIPTYKESISDKDIDGNIFGFTSFNMEVFNNFLEKNDITLLFKLHPNEENLVYKKYSKFLDDRIILISSKELEDKRMDLYKIVNAIDLLITDYSSIYFDYLLLDRPIIFTPVDLQEYRDTRGLLLEPYEFWTPGDKCLDQECLQEKILVGLNDPAHFKSERKIIRDIFHKYQDGKSTDRIMELIEKVMEDKTK